jgi:serine/threonine-protein kinase
LNINAGVRVGPYEIVAPIGAGGMGEVYRARDDRLGRDVALKVLGTDLAASGEHLKRFEQEARAASALNHPNIITIYEIGRSGPLSFIAMELIDGRDVRMMLAGEQIPIKQTLRIAVKVADGLAAAHERGIVHRDLKPENVMLTRDGFVKILDFGLAKLVRPFQDTDTTLPHTTPGAVFGTVGYMSPEQAAGREIDFRSDQFALGVILYEMLTGRLPFNAPTAAETLAAIIRNDPRPISQFNQNVPPDVVRVVERLLAKEPADRYASTRDLARDLRELRERITSSPPTRYPSDHPVSMPPRRLAWIAGATAAVLLLSAIALMIERRSRSAAARRPSVVVLPFRDVTGSPEGQAYTDGLAELISWGLTSRAVRVIPRFAEPGSAGDPVEQARKLGATFALSGAVQRLGNTVNLNYALVDAATGEQVAGETVNAGSTDLFTLHERVVVAIVTAMRVGVGGAGKGQGPPSELTTAEDQAAYVQVLGLLQRSRDEKSIDQAITTLNRLLRNARDSAAVNAQLARALVYKSQLSHRTALLEQATVYAERARDLDESLPEVHIRLGQIRNMTGRHAEAATEFQRALELRADDPDAVLGLASTNAAMGRAASADTLYRRAIILRPEYAGAYNQYGVFLLSNNRYPEAVANFKRFTELVPDAARGYLNLGAAYQFLGRYDEALNAYTRSVSVEPTGDALSNLATLEFYLGHYAEASRAYEKAAALSPSNFVVWVNLADAYRWTPGMRGKSVETYEKAIAMGREALAVNPRNASTHALIATSLAKAGRINEAVAAIDTALKLNPTDANVLYAAAVVATLRGAPETAQNWLQRAIDAGYPPGDVERDPELKALQTKK